MTLTFTGPFGEDFHLFPKQETFITAKPEARFRTAIAGRGGGKTAIGVIAMVLEIEKGKPRDVFVIVAPTYPMLEGAVMPEFEKRYWHKIKRYDKVHRRATDYKGRMIFFRSSEHPNKIRGLHPKAMLLDEAGQMKKEAWDIANGCVAVELGRIYITTTPYLRAPWLKTELFDHRNDPEHLFVRWKSHENPKFSINEYERLKGKTDPRFFAQEYDAEFIQISGLVWPEFARKIHEKAEEAEFSERLPIYWSMDFGVNMPTFVGFYQIDPAIGENGQVKKIDEIWQTDMDFWSIMDNLVLPRYPKMPKFVSCDPTGNYRDKVAAISHVDVLKSYARKHKFVIRYKKNWNDAKMRMKGITEVRGMLIDPDGFRIHPRCTHSIQTFENYMFQENTDIPLKDGIHDHPAEELQYFSICRPKYYYQDPGSYEEPPEIFAGTGY